MSDEADALKPRWQQSSQSGHFSKAAQQVGYGTNHNWCFGRWYHPLLSTDKSSEGVDKCMRKVKARAMGK